MNRNLKAPLGDSDDSNSDKDRTDHGEHDFKEFTQKLNKREG